MSWAQEELKNLDLGDKRLNERGAEVLHTLGNKPTLSIPAACGGWSETKATYNFFSNDKVDRAEILKTHHDEIIKRSENDDILLCPQDTSELDFTSQKNNDAHGFLNRTERKGHYLHATLVTTPNRLCLGVLEMKVITRDQLKNQMSKEEKKIHKALPLENKESYRWVESYIKACEFARRLPEKQVISMGDRECDFYDFLSTANSYMNTNEPYADWIIRGTWNRNTKAENGDESTIINEVSAESAIAEVEFIMPARDGVAARRVKQQVKIKRVQIKSPDHKSNLTAEGNQIIYVTAILASEIDVPEGCEAVEWLLLSNIQVNLKEEALNILRWYLCRWDIEIFFKILKSGCEIEKMQLKTAASIENCLAIYMLVAWRILYITVLGRECPDMPADIVFSDYEWQAVCIATTKKPPPPDPPKVHDMVIMIASLGGFLNRKSDGNPGVKVIWAGMQRMLDMAVMLEMLSSPQIPRATYG